MSAGIVKNPNIESRERTPQVELAMPGNWVASAWDGPLTHCVFAKKSNGAIIGYLVLAVFLWGGNNEGTKYLVNVSSRVWIGCTRIVFRGPLMVGVIRSTGLLGACKRMA